jgi:hypothetical protein
MKTQKYILGTLVGAITWFILGFVVYALLLGGFFESQVITDASKEPMVWWAMILGNLATAALITYIFGRWAGIRTFAAGAQGGAVIGFFLSLGINSMMYSMTTLSTLTGHLSDVIVYTVISAVVGGVVGWILGMGSE